MALVWTKSIFDEMYSVPCWRHGVRGINRIPRFHYNWYPMKHSVEQRVALLLQQPGFAQLQGVAIIGGGFGWTAEILIQNGVNAISVDTSQYVIDNKNTTEEADLRQYLIDGGYDPDNLPIFMDPNDPNREMTDAEVWSTWLHPSGQRSTATVYQEDISRNGDRNSLKRSFNIDAILSEYALDSMADDAESLSFAESCEQLRPNPSVPVVHMVVDGSEGDPRLNNHTLFEWRTLLDNNGFTNQVLITLDGRRI